MKCNRLTFHFRAGWSWSQQSQLKPEDLVRVPWMRRRRDDNDRKHLYRINHCETGPRSLASWTHYIQGSPGDCTQYRGDDKSRSVSCILISTLVKNTDLNVGAHEEHCLLDPYHQVTSQKAMVLTKARHLALQNSDTRLWQLLAAVRRAQREQCEATPFRAALLHTGLWRNTRLPLHHCTLHSTACLYIITRPHRNSSKLLYGHTGLSLHYYTATQDCLYIIKRTHRTASTLLHGHIGLPLHYYTATQDCLYIVIRPHRTASTLLYGHTGLPLHYYTATQDCLYIIIRLHRTASALLHT